MPRIHVLPTISESTYEIVDQYGLVEVMRQFNEYSLNALTVKVPPEMSDIESAGAEVMAVYRRVKIAEKILRES